MPKMRLTKNGASIAGFVMHTLEPQDLQVFTNFIKKI